MVQQIKDPEDARHSPLDQCTIRLDKPAFVIPITSIDQLQQPEYNLSLLQMFCLFTHQAMFTGHLQHTNPQTRIQRSRFDQQDTIKSRVEDSRHTSRCICYIVLARRMFSLAIFITSRKSLIRTFLYFRVYARKVLSHCDKPTSESRE